MQQGSKGWIALGAGVSMFEILTSELLSQAVDRWLSAGGWRKIFVYYGVLVTAAHLLNWLERLPWVDPYQLLARLNRRIR